MICEITWKLSIGWFGDWCSHPIIHAMYENVDKIWILLSKELRHGLWGVAFSNTVNPWFEASVRTTVNIVISKGIAFITSGSDTRSGIQVRWKSVVFVLGKDCQRYSFYSFSLCFICDKNFNDIHLLSWYLTNFLSVYVEHCVKCGEADDVKAHIII